MKPGLHSTVITIGLDVIYEAFKDKKLAKEVTPTVLIIPINTLEQSLKIAKELRKDNINSDIAFEKKLSGNLGMIETIDGIRPIIETIEHIPREDMIEYNRGLENFLVKIDDKDSNTNNDFPPKYPGPEKFAPNLFPLNRVELVRVVNKLLRGIKYQFELEKNKKR